MKVKELLADPSHWVKGNYAINGAGKQTWSLGEEAVAFCLRGAVLRCYRSPEERAKVLRRLREAVAARIKVEDPNEVCLFVFNDRQATHADILAVCEAADV